MNKKSLKIDKNNDVGQTYGFCDPGHYKTASLLFDKLWYAPKVIIEPFGYSPRIIENDSYMPESIKFRMPHLEADIFRGSEAKRCMDLFLYYDHQYRRKNEKTGKYEWDMSLTEYEILTEIKHDAFVRMVSEWLADRGVPVVPLYWHEDIFGRIYESGISQAYKAVLEYVPIVDPRKISWEQILEFRKDKNALGRYRKLRNWMSSVLIGESIDEAVNIVGEKLDD